MRQDVLELVKQLSLADSKTLSQKSNKLFEEGGELAKVILPYESAAGTLHRVVHKSKLLEEAADVILVALSIAYELGFDDDAITSEMQRKAMYWAKIQKTESGINAEKIPHEIHVTVESASDIDSFKLACKTVGVKPVVLALHTKASEQIRDVMTSQVVIGTTAEAFASMHATEAGLVGQGYNVVRSKIEAAPWHPAAPTNANGLVHKEGNYFETHIEVFVDESEGSEKNLAHLKERLKIRNGVHVSNNYFKSSGDVRTVMVTLRDHESTFERFNYNVVKLKALLVDMWGFAISPKEIIEYAIYDSKVSHDAAWMKNG